MKSPCILPRREIETPLKIGENFTTKLKHILKIPQRKSEIDSKVDISPSKLHNFRLFLISIFFIYNILLYIYIIYYFLYIFYLLKIRVKNRRWELWINLE